MLFLKYISDVWRDHYEAYKRDHGDEPELIEKLMEQEQFVLPKGASFYDLHNDRHKSGNGERIDTALHAIEEANGTKLRDVFQDISFNANKLGDEEQKNDILRHLLEDFAKPTLDMRPSRVGALDIIGGAYEYLISRFAASAGKKAGEFYTPAEVSTLMAKLVEPQEGDDVCDPTCGSGSLLLKVAREIKAGSGGKAHYISLSNVEQGRIIEPLEHMTFADAPSRARRVVREGDVLMATVRPNLLGFARIGKDHSKCVASTGFAVLSPSKEADASYLYHYLFGHHMRSQVHALVVGSNYPAINSRVQTQSSC